ncbi:hypothetical protein OH807_04490 [Kitasatospora sp. NBC_01560]|uniref:hypothetical protein n=1 Tax=Kitasatospora sp. NBC_01560 TaxID=2975965 RepID=UPI00386F73E6
MLAELGKKLAEKWLTLLVLPGALYLAVGVAADLLGHAHPFDAAGLSDRVGAWAKAPALGTFGGQAVLLAAVGVAAAGVGVVVQALGSLVERLHLAADWRGWPAGVRTLADLATRRRHARWQHRRELAGRARAQAHIADPASRPAASEAAAEARAAVHRVGAEEPVRPTWSGDRVHLAALRVRRHYGLDLAALWPYLWLTLPDPPRAEVTAARQALARAATLTAWAVLYLPLALWWWPALIVAAVLALTGHHRFRAAADGYATLLEAVVRLHAVDLARRLGLDCAGPLTAADGARLAELLVPRPPSTASATAGGTAPTLPA